MTYDTMDKNGRTYYRAQCDYPGCEAKYEGDEYDYRETPDLAAEDATSLDMWLAMTDRNGSVLFFCPKHLRLNERGYTLGYDFVAPAFQPADPKLNAYYETDGIPIPRPECERTILDLLERPTCDYPHCGSTSCDRANAKETE